MTNVFKTDQATHKREVFLQTNARLSPYIARSALQNFSNRYSVIERTRSNSPLSTKEDSIQSSNTYHNKRRSSFELMKESEDVFLDLSDQLDSVSNNLSSPLGDKIQFHNLAEPRQSIEKANWLQEKLQYFRKPSEINFVELNRSGQGGYHPPTESVCPTTFLGSKHNNQKGYFSNRNPKKILNRIFNPTSMYSPTLPTQTDDENDTVPKNGSH